MKNDNISRQAAIDALYHWSEHSMTNAEAWHIKQVIGDIKSLPSAQPEQRWIPCSERLPEEHESIWAKAKGTDRWSEAMWEKQSDEVIVTELFEDGTTRTETACTHDGEWYVKVKIVKRKIIAWMPLPEPYKVEVKRRTDE